MATHEYVVRRIAVHHRNRGEEVQADVGGFEKPRIVKGVRGRNYMPDMFVSDRDVIHEVETDGSVMNPIPQIRAFYKAVGGKRLCIVVCTGTDKGARIRKRQLDKLGVRCRVLSYVDLRFW